MEQKRHQRCPHCSFLETVKRGKRAGHTRYYCKNCGKYCTDRRTAVSDKNKEIWFRRWVVGKESISQLATQSPYSARTLKRYFYEQLPHCPVWHIQRAIPDMFNFTRYERVPKSSNSIEAFFGHLKDNLRLHRGLSQAHFKDFVKWYLFFHSNQNQLQKERESRQP